MSTIINDLITIATIPQDENVSISEIEIGFLNELLGSRLIFRIISILLKCDRPISLTILSKILKHTIDSIQHYISNMELKGMICQDFSWKIPHIYLNCTDSQKKVLKSIITNHKINQIIELTHVLSSLVKSHHSLIEYWSKSLYHILQKEGMHHSAEADSFHRRRQ